MKRVAFFSLGWSLASPPEIQEKEKAQVAALLREIGLESKYNPDKNWYPFRVKVGSEVFEMLIKIAQESDIVHLGRIEQVHSLEELESFPLLLWRLTNQAIEDDWYDLTEDGYQGGPKASHKRCPACRAELEQVRDLLVNVRKMEKRDLSLTYGFEVILSVRLAEMLQESGLTGFTLRPVWDYRRPYQGEPRLFQLVVTNVLPPMAAPPTEFEGEQRCEVCGTESKYIKHTHWWGRIQYYEETNLYYSRDVLGMAADFNKTTERFGYLPASDPYVLISQRAYQWLREKGIKGWKVEPVYLVE
jgi:hypothetical protein